MTPLLAPYPLRMAGNHQPRRIAPPHPIGPHLHGVDPPHRPIERLAILHPARRQRPPHVPPRQGLPMRAALPRRPPPPPESTDLRLHMCSADAPLPRTPLVAWASATPLLARAGDPWRPAPSLEAPGRAVAAPPQPLHAPPPPPRGEGRHHHHHHRPREGAQGTPIPRRIRHRVEEAQVAGGSATSLRESTRGRDKNIRASLTDPTCSSCMEGNGKEKPSATCGL